MQEKRAVWWAELSWPEVDEVLKNTDTVLLPMGSTEQHGEASSPLVWMGIFLLE